MSRPSRRHFLRTAGAGVAGLSALDVDARAGPTVAPIAIEATDPAAIPPHRAIAVPGVHAYPLEHSVSAGETLEVCVSASVPYRLTIARLGPAIDDPAGDAVLVAFPESQPAPHPIHPGSYVHVETPIPGPLRALSLECWVRPWSVKAAAGLISQSSLPDACNFGLFLRPGGAAAFYVGDGGPFCADCERVSPPDRLKAGTWHHVAGSWDGREAALYIDGRCLDRREFGPDVKVVPGPLRLAASGEVGVAAHFLDGDLASPAIHGRGLTGAEVRARFEDRGRTPPPGDRLLASWPLDEERGDRVADASGNGRHGRVINHATWGIGGPPFDSDVPRFGDYDPAADPDRGHALRFASDDLYDCRWPVTHRWAVPADARPGLYVARFRFASPADGSPRESSMTFVVRRAPSRPRASILVIAATNTWRAYSGTPFAAEAATPPTPEGRAQVWGTGGVGKDPGLPAFNLYRPHAAGQGTYQVGLRLPWPVAGPHVLYGGPTNYSHLARADRFLHAWLEQNGYEYDLISDIDLHRNPEILKNYGVVAINGHNEYWSSPMYRGLEGYLRGGGMAVVLSGNTLFWRVSFDDACTVMECRKVDAPGNQVPADRRGEAWHSHDGLQGGLLRECGLPGWRLVGLDTLGWNNPGNPRNFGPYVAEAPEHPFFRTPEDTGLKPGDRFGWSGDFDRTPTANGHEFDVRPSTLAALQEGPDPEGASVPADPPGIVRLANGVIPWSQGGAAFDYFFRPIKPKTEQGGEMIDWVRPDGGRVFHAGSIGAGWALHADPRWAALFRNVLHHFGVPRPAARP